MDLPFGLLASERSGGMHVLRIQVVHSPADNDAVLDSDDSLQSFPTFVKRLAESRQGLHSKMFSSIEVSCVSAIPLLQLSLRERVEVL